MPITRSCKILELQKNLQLCYNAILNVKLHCSSIVKPKNYILFFFTFCFLSLLVLFLIYSLSHRAPPSSVHTLSLISHVSFSFKACTRVGVGLVVMAWRSAWILDFGSAWIGGDRRSWWVVFGSVSYVGHGLGGGFGVVG